MMCVSRIPSDSENDRWIALVTSSNASPGAVAYTWSPTRATVAVVPIDGPAPNHGAVRARSMLKMPTPGRGHVPSPLLPAGSEPTGHPSGPPGWLHDIATSRFVFSAAVVNGCEAAPSVVSVIRWA